MSADGFYAVARVGQQRIAVDLAWVAGAISPRGTMQAPPRRDGALAGLASTEQGLLPVAELRQWLPIDSAGQASPRDAAILVLQQDGRRIGLHTDGLAGLARLKPGSIQRLHHGERPEELFDAAALTEDGSSVSVLEPQRLMDLMSVWSQPLEELAADEGGTASDDSNDRRCALLQCAGAWIAVPVQYAGELVPLPALEMRWPGAGSTSGMLTWRGKPVAVLDPEQLLGVTNNQTARWGMLLAMEDKMLLLPTQDFAGLCDAPAALEMGQRWLDEQQREIQLLDARALLEELPEADLGGTKDMQTANTGDRNPDAYMVFEADQYYALPISEVQAVLRGNADMAGKSLLEWRGQQLPLRHEDPAQGAPAIVLVLGQGCELHARTVRRLLTLVPAWTAKVYPVPGTQDERMLTLDEPRSSYRIMRL